MKLRSVITYSFIVVDKINRIVKVKYRIFAQIFELSLSFKTMAINNTIASAVQNRFSIPLCALNFLSTFIQYFSLHK